MEQWAVGAGHGFERNTKKIIRGATAQKKRLNRWCLLGQIQIEERIWPTRTSTYERVFASRIGVSNRGGSKTARWLLSDFSAGSLAKAARQCKEHDGLEIPPSGAWAAGLERARTGALEFGSPRQGTSSPAPPARGSEHVVAGADGTIVCTVEPGKRKAKRPRSWQEMRLVAAQSHGCSQDLYAATFGKVGELGRRWAHSPKSAGWGLERKIHVVADRGRMDHAGSLVRKFD